MADASKKSASSASGMGTAMAGGVKTVASGAASAIKTVGTTVKNIASTVTSATEAMVRGTVSATGKVVDAVANAGKLAAGIATAGLGVASAATVKLGKDAFDAYGEYEQLAGGIETLFGENSPASQAIKAYADNAFSTVQMSANDYMSTVTDFSATLLQKLDPTEAADKADQALRQMSDNANKMGTSIGSVEDAYRGLAKANATMLDNLKLGYGGNQGELARLINDAGVLGDVIADEKNVWDVASFDKIIDAIGVIQERLGMAGVSQEEALHTIQGSINMTKAAWENLLAGWANPDADLDKLTENLMVSVDAVQENALPAIERILTSMGDAVTKSAPNISRRLTALIQTTSPTLMRSAASLMGTVGRVVLDTLPDIVDSGVAAIADLIENTDGGDIVTSAINAAQRLAGTLSRYAPAIIGKVLGGAKTNAPQIRAGIVSIVNTLFGTFQNVIANGDLKDIASTVTDTMLDIVGIVAQNAPAIVDGMFGIAQTVITTALQRVKEDPQGFVQSVLDILGAIVGGAVSTVGSIAPLATEVITALFDGGFDGVNTSSLGERVNSILGGLFDGVTGLTPESVVTLCTNIVTTIADGLAPAIETAIPTLTGFVASLVTAITSEDNLAQLGTAGDSIVGAVCGGIQTASENGDVSAIRTAAFSTVANVIKWLTDPEKLQEMTDAGHELVTALSDGLDDDTENLITACGDAIGNIIKWLTSENNLARIVVDVAAVGAAIGTGIINGLTDMLSGALRETFAAILSPFMSGEEVEQWKKDWDKSWSDMGLHLDSPTGDELFTMFSSVGDPDYLEKMRREQNAKAYGSKAWSMDDSELARLGIDRNGQPIQIHTTVDVDGRTLGETNDEYDQNAWYAYGH